MTSWRMLALALLLAGCGKTPSPLALQARHEPIPTPVLPAPALAPRVTLTSAAPNFPSLAQAVARVERAPLENALARWRRGLDAAPHLSYRIRALASLAAGHASLEARASWVSGRLDLQVSDSNVLGVVGATLVFESGDRLKVFRGPLTLDLDLGDNRWATLAPWLGWGAPDVALARLSIAGWRVISTDEGLLEGRPVKRLEVVGPANEALELAFETTSPYISAITSLGSDAQRRQLVFDRWLVPRASASDLP